MKKEWDERNYSENFKFVHQYGEKLLDLITVPPGSFVVDLGCGNGALTQKLAKSYKVIGIDQSPQMLQKAKQLCPNVEFLCEDACTFTLESKADAVFSNAVFHWIENQDKLIENIAANLNPGGELVFEFGGKGCADTVHKALYKAFDKYGYEYRQDFNFRSIGEFAPILEKHGFKVEYARLYDRPTPQNGANGLENWIRMFVTTAFNGVAEKDKDQIIRDAAEICRPSLFKDGVWCVDYVRLLMKAVKLPGAEPDMLKQER